MSRRPKRLGFETDLWVIIGPDGRIPGGDYRPYVYWTKAQAKRSGCLEPGSTLRPVRLVEVAPPVKEQA